MGRFQVALNGVVAGGIGLLALGATAFAAPVQIVSQDDSDFLTLPSSSLSPYTSSTTGTVYFNVTGSVANVYRSPFENAHSTLGATQDASNGGWQLPGFDKLPYTSVQANSSATYSFMSPATEINLLWGSPDSYNYITFFSGANGSGTNEGTISGSALDIQTYGHDQVLLELAGDLAFSSVTFYSEGSNAFEFANLDPPAVPLPGTLPLIAGGLSALGWLTSRRKRKAA